MALNELIADYYNNSETYAVGDFCIYDNTLYKCSTEINVAEDFTIGHWTKVVLVDELNQKVSDVQVNGTSIVQNGVANIPKASWELIADITVSEDTSQIDITTDINGEPFALSEMLIRAYLEPSTTGANDYISASNLVVNNVNVNTVAAAPTKRYMANGVKTYFEYESRIHGGISLSSGRSASVPNSTSSVEQITSEPNAFCQYYRGFRLSRYSANLTLIPKNSVIKIYGIRI